MENDGENSLFFEKYLHSIVPLNTLMQGGELQKTEIKVSNLTYYKKVVGLVPYARYDVTVAGFTIAGDGPSQMKPVGK